MKMLCTAALLAALTTLTAAGSAEAFGLNGARSALKQAPPPDYQGQWYTTPDGCSYSRAQAPGYPPTWHLINNPHHIGKPNAKRGCPAMLQS